MTLIVPKLVEAIHQGRGGRALYFVVRVIAAATLAFGAATQAGAGSSAPTQNDKWSLRFEPIHMQARGHDQHVLTIHEIDPSSQMDRSRAVTLDTEKNLAYRSGFRYSSGEWSWGVDFLWFDTSQSTPDITAAASGTSAEVVFEVPDRSFTSSSPGESLFYRVLEDTDMALWTLDFYGMKTLTETAESSLKLQIGVRFGDFDNDYRAAVGIEDAGGLRFDASSNYGRMTGLLIGLAGHLQHGRSSLDAHLGQSVLFGSAELTNMSREFTGPFSESATFVSEDTFSTERDVAIPITELRVAWTYAVIKHVSVSLGVHSSVWWDVSVPPGVIPAQGGNRVLHENTIAFLGVSGAVVISF
ncbi:MAG TPA: hypothetical protein VGA56_15325 [Opitutaceae bacterium]